MKPSFHEWAGDRRLKGLVLLVLALAAVALGAYTYFSLKTARYSFIGPTTISVRGVGEAVRVPDVASFSFGVQAESAEAAAAQEMSAKKVNAALAYLREQGVADADVKTTAYNLYPRYEILPPALFDQLGREPRIIGYTADQTITVKVRDAAKAGALIAGVGERGATNVSGLSFTVDDEEAAKAEAREMAVADARERAEHLAEALGVRLVRITGFWEEDPGQFPVYDRAFGGDGLSGISVAPELPRGENTVSSAVNITYEIR